MRHSCSNNTVFIFSPGAVSDDASDCERDGCSPGQQASLQERVTCVRELERWHEHVQPEKTKKARGKRRNTAYHRFSALPYITTPACLLQHASSPYRTAFCNPTQISQHNLPIKHGNGCLQHHRNATNENFSISLFGETEFSVFQEEVLPIEGGEWVSKNFFISRPRRNLFFFAVSIVEFHCFHYGIPLFQLRNSVQWIKCDKMT